MTRHEITIGESERWLSVILGGMLALSSLRRRDLGAGALFALAGGALIFRGVVGHDGLLQAAGSALEGRLEGERESVYDEAEDEVEESLMESFPASDPPSWTPTAGDTHGDLEADTEEPRGD